MVKLAAVNRWGFLQEQFLELSIGYTLRALYSPSLHTQTVLHLPEICSNLMHYGFLANDKLLANPLQRSVYNSRWIKSPSDARQEGNLEQGQVAFWVY